MCEVSDELFAVAFYKFQAHNFWRVCELGILDLKIHTFCRNKELVFDKNGLRPLKDLSDEFRQIFDNNYIEIHDVDTLSDFSESELDQAKRLIQEVVRATKKLDRNPH